jgi:hypothetical protein
MFYALRHPAFFQRAHPEMSTFPTYFAKIPADNPPNGLINNGLGPNVGRSLRQKP